PPLAGFFSKEAVLGGVWEAHLTGPFLMLALTALLTAFYMFRVVFVAFFGRAHAGGHPHEAPWLMRGPLWLLAILTLLVGILYALTALTLRAGDGLRHIQSGRAQDYVYGVAFGVLFLFVWAQLWRR